MRIIEGAIIGEAHGTFLRDHVLHGSYIMMNFFLHMIHFIHKVDWFRGQDSIYAE